jgi:hypothetical protein
MKIQDYEFENNPRIMKRVQWIHKARKYDHDVACDWCMGGKGCNKRAKRNAQPQRSWKEYRKTQWK